jgi:hypothetical protein
MGSRKARPKEPALPAERRTTIRREIMDALQGRTLSARELSIEVGVPERDVYEHLEHIRMSAGGSLAVAPAECRKCGFVFRKREKLRRPGRCPACNGESIAEPLFSIARKARD